MVGRSNGAGALVGSNARMGKGRTALSARRLLLGSTALIGAGLAATPALAQNTYTVNTEAELSAAIAGANANAGSTIVVGSNITLANLLPVVTASTTFQSAAGNTFTISGNNQYRLFFIDAGAGAVNFNGLVLSGGKAQGGNGGLGGGGGGMGAGGAIFVNSGNVTATDVAFTGNAAAGGNGAALNTNGSGGGGGGGLGGSGGGSGNAGGGGGGYSGGGGGGGSQLFNGNPNGTPAGAGGAGPGGAGGSGSANANGAAGTNGGAGGAAVTVTGGATVVYGGGGGGGGTNGGAGGSRQGGGGGGAGYTGAGGTGGSNNAGGTSGGIGGGGGGSAGAGAGGNGGDFGGGGGGYYANNAGSGGFGGGGAGGYGYNAGGTPMGAGGAGGFGGGGGAAGGSGASGAGGAGAGTGSNNIGGGGMGAGGAVFVRNGSFSIAGSTSFSSGTVTGGTGGATGTSGDGAARGSALFLVAGTNTGIDVATGVTTTIADTISDDSAASLPGGTYTAGSGSGAQITKTGAGTLVLTGTNTYSGNTNVNGGTLQLGNGGATGSVGGFILLDNGSTLAINRSGAPTISNVIGGTGSLRLMAEATLTGIGALTGGVDIDAGVTATIGNIAASNSTSAAVRMGAGATLNTIVGQYQTGLYGVQNTAGAARIDNSGTISGVNGGVSHISAGALTLINSGSVLANTYAAVYINAPGANSIANGGTITGGSNAITGYGVSVNGGALTLNNNNGGTISGAAGAILLSSTGTQAVNLGAGSTTTGNIYADDTGTRTISVNGTFTGSYDATGNANAAVDSFTLAPSGSVSGTIALGLGNDAFLYQGGTLSSTVDGGGGTDSFSVSVLTGVSTTLNQSNLTGFESFAHNSGNLTLTGARDGGAGWVVAGGVGNAFVLNGSLTNVTGNAITLTNQGIVVIQSGAQLSATADVIYSSVDGNNISNAGTITASANASAGIAIGSGSVTNTGTITYSGGAITTQGNGVLASTNQLTLTNAAGASVIGRWDAVRAANGAYVSNSGLIRGDRFAGIESNGPASIFNFGTGRIYGATGEGSALLINSGNVNVTNAFGGEIVGTGDAAIYNRGTGVLNVSNAGTIATGTLDGTNNYVAGGTTTAIRSGNAAITNTGLIEGQAGGIFTTGTLSLANIGTITGRGTGTGNFDGINVGGVANILNAGAITQATYAGIYANSGGTITNAAAGTLTGGNGGSGGVGLVLGGGGTFNNYGTANSGSGIGVAVGSTGATINLFSGSSTGNVIGGSGNDVLAIYSGQVNGSAVTQSYTDVASGAAGTVTLQNAGTLAAATFGTVDLGNGYDTLQLRGTGTAAQAGSFSLATSTGAEGITKLDSGTWTLTGAAVAPGIRINAGTGTAAGTLAFNGTTGLTGSVYVNGATVLANTAGAFGSATLHMVDPTVQFAAAGTFANAFVLDVASPASADPTLFQNLSGGAVTLSGNITTGSGANANGQAIAAAQYVTFDGTTGSSFTLSGVNSWSGTTTINPGMTLTGTTQSISGGNIVDNGTLVFSQNFVGTYSTAISGTGALAVNGGGTVALFGSNSYAGATTVSGGGTVLQVGDGGTNGTLGTGDVTVDSGAQITFARTDNYNFANSVSGAGTVRAVGTDTLSGNLTHSGTLLLNSNSSGTITLAGARSNASASAVTLGGTGVTLAVASTGSVAGGAYLGVRVNGTGNTLTNFGSITNTGTGGDAGYGAAVGVASTGGTTTITNGSTGNSTAAISGQNGGINHIGSGGIVATGLLTVNNYGLVSGNFYNAIENQNGTGALTVTNYASGRVVGQGNAGGGSGIGMGGTGALTLINAGLIVGRTSGISSNGSIGITNSGTIAAGTLSSGTSGTLVAGGGNGILAVGGSITNQAGGVIRGSFLGGNGSDTNAITSSAALTVENSGQILGVAIGSSSSVRTNGVFVSAGAATITNHSGGLITGGWDGLYLVNGGSVTNSGTIAGNRYFGIEIATGVTSITNNLGGGIYGVYTGLILNQTGSTLDNAGTISAASYDSSTGVATLTAGNAVLINSGAATITNTGTISAGGYGIVSNAGALRITNSGTISGGTGAINSSGTYNDIVTLNAGSITTGAISLADGDDTVNWNGGSFTSISAGLGTDTLNVSLAAPAVLALPNATSFEVRNLLSGNLTLTGTASGQAGWTLSANTVLGFGAAGQAANWTGSTAVTVNGADARVNIAAGSTISASVWAVTGGATGTSVYNDGTLSATGTGAALNLTGASSHLENTGAITATPGGNYSVVWMSGAGASVINSGTITGVTGLDNYAAGLVGTGSSFENRANATVTGALGVYLGANGTLTNAGSITAGTGNGVTVTSGTVTNSGTIASNNAVSGAGVYLRNGGTLGNTGTIGTGAELGVFANATSPTAVFTVTNSNMITGVEAGVYAAAGALNLTNQAGGTVRSDSGAAVYLAQGGGVDNASTVQGGTGTDGWGVQVAGGDVTIANHAGGTIGGTAGAMSLGGAGSITVSLDMGSVTNGLIRSTDAGTRTIEIAGTLNGDYVSTGTGVDYVTLRTGGAMQSANLGDGDDRFTYLDGTISGIVDGGAGNDSLFGDFGAGNSGSVTLANFTNFEAFGLLSGDLTLNGPSANPDADVYAGNGSPAGTVTFTNTGDLTGDIYVNGGDIRASTAGAFGSGTIHMIDPTAFFGATGTYANAISLEVQSPATSNPSTLSADAGVVATLSGAITQGTGAGVDPQQPLVITGQGTIILTNSGNNWAGVTTITAGSTLQGASNTISGSAITANGALNYVQPGAGTVAQNISGTGAVNVSGLGAGQALTFSGTNTVTGGIAVLDASALTNTGTLGTGGNTPVVRLTNGGSFRNEGTVNGDTLSSGPAAASVTNIATINGALVNSAAGSLSVTNQAGALIQMTGNAAVRGTAGAGALLVVNAGDIGGTTGAVDGSNAGDTITNSGRIIGGTISGPTYSTGFLANAITLNAGGTVDNQAGGLIDGGYGVVANGALNLTNAAGATIQGKGAVAASAGGTIVNAGTIRSSDSMYGISTGGVATITNSGTIEGGSDTTDGWGVDASDTLTFTNLAGGTLGGTAGAIRSSAAATIDLQAGSTTTGAIALSGGAASSLTIGGGYTGAVTFGSGDDTLTLVGGAVLGPNTSFDGGAGTDALVLAGTGDGSFDAGLANTFETRAMNGTGVWTLTGTDTTGLGWQVNAGTLAASNGAIDATALVTVAAPGSFALLGDMTIGGLAGNGTVQLGATTLTLAGTSSFAGGIAGTGNLAVANGAAVTLSGSNSFTGETQVAGTLILGASDVLADGSTLTVATGGTLDLGGNSDAVASAILSGTLNGTGTLNGAVVNANLGGGTLTQASGSSVLNGTSAAGDVVVQGGTLTLGGSNRVSDTATLLIASGGVFDIGAFDETVGQATIAGTLAGTGTLTASAFTINGGTVLAHLAGGPVSYAGDTVQYAPLDSTAVNITSTLHLGASNVLPDDATVTVAAGGTLDMASFDDTIALLKLSGTLDGTGTLTATEYRLSGGTVNAHLGTGTLTQVSGSSTLNNTAAARVVNVTGGMLNLGGSNLLADNAALTIASGATLNLGANSDTVGTAAIAGTLNGSGTLTANLVQLDGATVNANLGGSLTNTGGRSVLNGTASGANVAVTGGTLALGAADRLSDSAALIVASGATFDLGGFNETVGTASIAGTLAGSGTLTAGEFGLNGATVNANLGTGTLTQLGGTSILTGSSAAANVAVQGGTLALGASNRLADTAALSVAAGSVFDLGGFSDTVGTAAIAGTVNGTGTLTAGTTTLNGATVNAKLGTGTLVQASGSSTLNNSAASGVVNVTGGTLNLGGSNLLADTAALNVAGGATFNLGANSDTVGTAVLAGTLAGTGTLTAASYQLTGASVNANLGAGTLVQAGGTSTLTGTSAAGAVAVQAGTLRLGGSERLANTAVIGINTGGTFDLAGYTETVSGITNGASGGGTLALGAGRLVLSGNGDSAFSGAITGSGSIDKQGSGRLSLTGAFANTGRIDVSAGTLAFNGSSQASLRVQGGTLTGNGSFAGALTLASGTLAPGGLVSGGAGQPIGSFTAGSLAVSGGTLLFEFGGSTFNFASDSIRVNGAAVLTGGTVQVSALTTTASDYRFNQLYTIVQANSLTGTFTNGTTFASVDNNPNLKWRLRYDLVANAVVLQVQKNVDFGADAVGGSPNQQAVAAALMGGAGGASDSWSAALNTLAALAPAQRLAAFNSLNGEAIADSSTVTLSANALFTSVLQQRVGDGDDGLVGSGFTASSLGDVRVAATQTGKSFASRLVAGSDGESRSGGGVWAQGFGGWQRLSGRTGTAGVESTAAGVAAGFEGHVGELTLGVAGGLTQIDGDVDARNSTLSGTLYQVGGYASFDNGQAFVSASGNYYRGDFDTARVINLGGAISSARADFDSDGYSFGGMAGYRFDLGNGARLVPVITATQTHDRRDAFTETGAGGLGLASAATSRDLFTATGELRLGQWIRTGASQAMPYVTVGVRYNKGDLDTLGAMRFSGAPTGTGAFTVQGARMDSWVGTWGTGIDVKANDHVRMGVALEAAYGDHTREGRASARIKIGF
jgi:fibronectin-binding autotransporter adhesin